MEDDGFEDNPKQNMWPPLNSNCILKENWFIKNILVGHRPKTSNITYFKVENYETMNILNAQLHQIQQMYRLQVCKTVACLFI